MTGRKGVKQRLDDSLGKGACQLTGIRPCGGVLFVNINFDNAQSVAHGLFHFFEDGVHHLARLAPCGEEIDQHGLVVGYDVVECFRVVLF